MMKRFLSALLCACVLISMTGCAQDQEAPEDLLYSSAPIQFNSDSSSEEESSPEPEESQAENSSSAAQNSSSQAPSSSSSAASSQQSSSAAPSSSSQASSSQAVIQPGVVPELFFQPADLFQALRQQQCDGPFGRDAGSLVLLSGPLVDDQAEVPVGV